MMHSSLRLFNLIPKVERIDLVTEFHAFYTDLMSKMIHDSVRLNQFELDKALAKNCSTGQTIS